MCDVTIKIYYYCNVHDSDNRDSRIRRDLHLKCATLIK